MSRPTDLQTSQRAAAPVEAHILAIFAVVAATTLVAMLGGLMSGGDTGPWYQGLSKAPGTPPAIAFAIVWPTLFTLMSIGAILAWNSAGSWQRADSALGVYFSQLAANLGWSALFFRHEEPLAALIDLTILWVLIVVMYLEFRAHNRIAAQLQIPYLAWVSFAFYLNAWIVWNN